MVGSISGSETYYQKLPLTKTMKLKMWKQNFSSWIANSAFIWLGSTQNLNRFSILATFRFITWEQSSLPDCTCLSTGTTVALKLKCRGERVTKAECPAAPGMPLTSLATPQVDTPTIAALSEPSPQGPESILVFCPSRSPMQASWRRCLPARSELPGGLQPSRSGSSHPCSFIQRVMFCVLRKSYQWFVLLLILIFKWSLHKWINIQQTSQRSSN